MSIPFVHPTAIVEDGAILGDGSFVWHHSHVRRGATIGPSCHLGKNVYVEAGAVMGSGVKIQNNVSLYAGVLIEDNVFIGPSVVFTNDRFPRAWRREFAQQDTVVRQGASIGANATIICNIEIGEHAMIAAGSVVTRSVRAHELVVGNPARHRGWVCRCGEPCSNSLERPDDLRCGACRKEES